MTVLGVGTQTEAFFRRLTLSLKLQGSYYDQFLLSCYCNYAILYYTIAIFV